MTYTVISSDLRLKSQPSVFVWPASPLAAAGTQAVNDVSRANDFTLWPSHRARDYIGTTSEPFRPHGYANTSAKSSCGRYQSAESVFELLEVSTTITPINSAHVTTPANPPMSAPLSCPIPKCVAKFNPKISPSSGPPINSTSRTRSALLLNATTYSSTEPTG